MSWQGIAGATIPESAKNVPSSGEPDREPDREAERHGGFRHDRVMSLSKARTNSSAANGPRRRGGRDCHQGDRSRWWCGLLVLVLMSIAGLTHAGDTSSEDVSVVTTFVRAYCLDCHSGADSEAGLDLQRSLGSITSDAAAWEGALRKLRTHQMPPPDADQPTNVEVQQVVLRLQNELDRAARKSPQAGRTGPFRRLTRFEYSNAIRDLLRLEIDTALLLPKDEVSHGFDNVTVEGLSPTLLNRYISAAQIISELAVGASVRPGGQTFRVRPDITQESHVPGLPLGTRGGILIPYHFPADGEYEISARLMRDRNEHVEGLRRDTEIDFLLDRKQIARLVIPRIKSATDHQTADQHLKVTVPVRAGTHHVAVTFPRRPPPLIETKRQPYEARINYHRSPRQEPAVYEVSITAVDVRRTAIPKSRDRLTESQRAVFGDVDPAVGSESQAKDILTRIARLAYRRPVTAEDLAQPMKFFRQGEADGGFARGIQDALAAILVNPNFIFRIERDPVQLSSGTVYRISDVELATRLSFFLWSSLPDEELLSLAEQQQLGHPQVLRRQVTRMLQDQRSSALVESFASQWLYLRNLENITPDGRLFPDFDHNLRTAFRTETELLFADVMKNDRSVLKLLKSDYTFLNERLAAHYGIPHIYGSRFRKVRIPSGSPRGGLLRHGSILTVTSYATRTSPVLRGHWILKNLLGAPPPPPPDDVPDLQDNTVDSTLSVRERLEAHRANPACASCHNQMDPIGFALENFDAVGRWRDRESGQPVDATGGFPGSESFSGVDGLEQALLQRPELFVSTLAEKLLTYALGRGVAYHDAPAIRKIVRDAGAADHRFAAVIDGIVQSVPFQHRVTE